MAKRRPGDCQFLEQHPLVAKIVVKIAIVDANRNPVADRIVNTPGGLRGYVRIKAKAANIEMVWRIPLFAQIEFPFETDDRVNKILGHESGTRGNLETGSVPVMFRANLLSRRE